MKASSDANPLICGRLQSHHLRVTAVRVHILEELTVGPDERMCVEEVFRRLVAKGVKTSIGSVYRVIRELENYGLLLRDWSEGGRATYWCKPDGEEASEPVLQLRHDASREAVDLDDPVLYDRLLQAARAKGVELANLSIVIHAKQYEAGKKPVSRKLR